MDKEKSYALHFVKVADEAETVNFSWNFLWKVFLALLIIGIVSSIIGYFLKGSSYCDIIGNDLFVRKRVIGRSD
jgi:hypothetical protein